MKNTIFNSNTDVVLYENISNNYQISNFVDTREKVISLLDTIKVNLTPENYEDEKKNVKDILANLNKFSVAFKEKADSILKDYKDKIEEGNNYTKSIQKIIVEKREEIAKQLEEFESAKRDLCYKVMQEQKEIFYQEYDIAKEFQEVKKEEISDISIISNLNDKDQLSSKGKKALLNLIERCKNKQDKILKRIEELSKINQENNLQISREDVSFLTEMIDEIYEDKLKAFVEREKQKIQKIREEEERKKQIEIAKIKEDEERKAKEMIEAEKRKNEEEKKKAEIEMQKKLQEEKEKTEKETRLKVEEERKNVTVENSVKKPINTEAIAVNNTKDATNVSNNTEEVFEVYFQLKFPQGKATEEKIRVRFLKDMEEKLQYNSFNNVIFVNKKI